MDTYRTYDIFNSSSLNTTNEAMRYCRDIALSSGLKCNLANKDGMPILEMCGTKMQFLKYYFKTISANETLLVGIKRLIDTLLW